MAFPDVEITTAPDNGAADFAVSTTGTIVFIPLEATNQRLRLLSWVDRRGKEEPLAIAPGASQLRSHFTRRDPRGPRHYRCKSRYLWIWNLQRASLTRLTDGPTEDLLPVWSTDGRRVFFQWIGREISTCTHKPPMARRRRE